MLGYLFLFYGRMGRLQYFLWSYIFVPAIFFMALVVLTPVFAFSPFLNKSPVACYSLVAIPFVCFLWAEFSLQAVRIRDIGWKPGVVMPAFVAINLVDFAVAYAVPTLADGTGMHTIVSTILGILSTLVLLFTPTDGQEILPFIIPGLSLPRVSLGFLHKKRSASPIVPKPRQQSFEERHYPREKVPFGRRGVT
ncbi:DUF805 domain-containing protein [Pleomorphomonas oryzae]|uniref:DUF805 domain-containing protein n=1 Tax=Pleomorphomonas oryzae TaxID=261934 RepID=UPI00041547CC|nr:hypothetical protein [Pleomorphomonas oryzae]